jgi:hypothetical protein
MDGDRDMDTDKNTDTDEWKRKFGRIEDNIFLFALFQSENFEANLIEIEINFIFYRFANRSYSNIQRLRLF